MGHLWNVLRWARVREYDRPDRVPYEALYSRQVVGQSVPGRILIRLLRLVQRRK